VRVPSAGLPVPGELRLHTRSHAGNTKRPGLSRRSAMCSTSSYVGHSQFRQLRHSVSKSRIYCSFPEISQSLLAAHENGRTLDIRSRSSTASTVPAQVRKSFAVNLTCDSSGTRYIRGTNRSPLASSSTTETIRIPAVSKPSHIFARCGSSTRIACLMPLFLEIKAQPVRRHFT